MPPSDRSAEVRGMIRDIEEEVRFTRHLIGRETLSPRVMEAMASIPRHEFVPAHLQDAAYANGPLPVGCGQTISQPYIVALMSDLLETRPEHVILEIGTGCGYQAAVLSALVEQVHSIEIVPELAASATERLARLGIENVTVHAGDGYAGWPDHAPYDGIIVTAAAPEVPAPLTRQLRDGGKLVIPLGKPMFGQELCVIERKTGGKISSHSILPVAFVPFTRSGRKKFR